MNQTFYNKSNISSLKINEIEKKSKLKQKKIKWQTQQTIFILLYRIFNKTFAKFKNQGSSDLLSDQMKLL